MADEAESAKGGSLSDKFSKAVGGFFKHLFSPTMIFMMVAMALPAVGMAATTAGTGATLGDIGLATVDMYVEMFKAPFTDGGVVSDAFGRAVEGDFAADSYEWGMMDHGNMEHHDMSGSSHDVGAGSDSGGHVGHSPEELTKGMSEQELAKAKELAGKRGISVEEFLAH